MKNNLKLIGVALLASLFLIGAGAYADPGDQEDEDNSGMNPYY